MAESRPPYAYDQLKRVLAPASVAIIGATPREGAFGERVLFNLGGYTGRIHLVNGRYETIGNRPCYPSVRALPEAPDCAVVAVGREAVEDVVRDCIAAGVGGAIVFASGYAETGKPERVQQQQDLAAIARAAGMPLIGPNCIGVSLMSLGARITFMPSDEAPLPTARAIGIVSQSGALGYALGQATQRGVSVSHVLTSGNSSDVDMADYVAFLADDPGCAAIALVFEGMSEPRRLLAAAGRAGAAGTPVVVCKLATGEQGAAAAMSHTGTLAGAEAAYRAAFEATGMVVVDDLEALVETTCFLAKVPPRPQARGVAVLATSGGAAIMAADKAELHRIELPQPRTEAREVLEKRIPEFGSPRNPVDVTAQVITDPESLPTCARALLADDQYGAMVLPVVYSGAVVSQRAPVYQTLAEASGKPLCVVWIAEWMEGPGSREMEELPDVPLFRSMDRCFAALAAWHRLADRRDAPRELPGPTAMAVRERAAKMIAAPESRTLTEREAKAVLALYDVPVVQEHLAGSADEAVAAAEALGYPVALKVESADIPHKTEAGAIRLSLRTKAAVRSAHASAMASALKAVPTARIAGVLVQPMVTGSVEVLIGGRVDPLFGPLVVVGLGGVMVEVLQDRAIGLAPLTPVEARAMLERLKGASLLRGFRGSEGVDMDALAEVVARVGAFLSDHADQVVELDINPIICRGRHIVAVDALIVRR
jgi:acyl-CoA synthetase (NDP forming)